MLSVAQRPTPTELDDATLRRAMRGDDAAARELVELYQARVFALVSRMLSGRGRATIEDIAQDTFLVVFRKIGEFDPRGTAKLSVWILGRSGARQARRCRACGCDPR